MITGLAHTGVCVPDCEAAVAYYRDVLGFTVLSPPYVMDGEAIRADMGELLADPAMKAVIVGFGDDGDRCSRSSSTCAPTAVTPDERRAWPTRGSRTSD
jgi:catechol 2,3-dioxygenase-like lactoylglutathione lyase family enzyme